ncbi:hypothetical protein HD806DRAFT_543601 [Xylariaceae sp. AK1471]|nr:hypothetical protein HD806DRAFT_543601 [Xylariaceae sp. AK1471]
MARGFESLSNEIIIMVMEQLPSYSELNTLVSASPQAFAVYCRWRSTVLEHIKENYIIPSVQGDLFSLMASSASQYYARRSSLTFSTRENIITGQEIMTEVVHYISPSLAWFRAFPMSVPGCPIFPVVKSGYLYGVIVLFIEDYIFKARSEPQIQVGLYQRAPWWAHKSLRRTHQSGFNTFQTLPEEPKGRITDAFFLFQTYCYLHRALQGHNPIDNNFSAKSGKLFQETLLPDFLEIMPPIRTEMFRSVLWYVSTVWAILLDELGYNEAN